jgi:hypothetical protein
MWGQFDFFFRPYHSGSVWTLKVGACQALQVIIIKHISLFVIILSATTASSSRDVGKPPVKYTLVITHGINGRRRVRDHMVPEMVESALHFEKPTQPPGMGRESDRVKARGRYVVVPLKVAFQWQWGYQESCILPKDQYRSNRERTFDQSSTVTQKKRNRKYQKDFC